MMMLYPISIGPSRDMLEGHEELLREFLAETFSVDLEEVDLNDGVLLSDFTGSWPRMVGGGATSRRSARAQWDTWLVSDIVSRFGVVPAAGVFTPLVALLDAIAAKRRQEARRPH